MTMMETWLHVIGAFQLLFIVIIVHRWLDYVKEHRIEKSCGE